MDSKCYHYGKGKPQKTTKENSVYDGSVRALTRVYIRVKPGTSHVYSTHAMYSKCYHYTNNKSQKILSSLTGQEKPVKILGRNESAIF